MMRTTIMAASFTLALAAGQSDALAQSCPSHAHATSTTLVGNVRTIHCGCDDGYVNYNDKCRRKSEVRAHLIDRSVIALKSAGQTAKSIAYETESMALKDFFGTSKDMAESLVLLPAMLSVSPRAQRAAIVAVLARVTSLLGTVAQCEGSENIKTNCENLKNFLKISRDSLEQAAKLY